MVKLQFLVMLHARRAIDFNSFEHTIAFLVDGVVFLEVCYDGYDIVLGICKNVMYVYFLYYTKVYFSIVLEIYILFFIFYIYMTYLVYSIYMNILMLVNALEEVHLVVFRFLKFRMYTRYASTLYKFYGD